MLSATKPAISIKHATTVCHFLRDLNLDFANVYMACPNCSFFYSSFSTVVSDNRNALTRPPHEKQLTFTPRRSIPRQNTARFILLGNLTISFGHLITATICVCNKNKNPSSPFREQAFYRLCKCGFL